MLDFLLTNLFMLKRLVVFHLIDLHPHYRFGALSTVHTETFENDKIAHCDVS